MFISISRTRIQELTHSRDTVIRATQVIVCNIKSHCIYSAIIFEQDCEGRKNIKCQGNKKKSINIIHIQIFQVVYINHTYRMCDYIDRMIKKYYKM